MSPPPGSDGARRSTRFDTAQVRAYYDRHTPAFITFGRGGGLGAIHRAVWAPGITTREDAFQYVNDRIAGVIRDALRDAPPPDHSFHVVDLGCGVGATLCYLAQRLPIRGTGVTLSPVQASLATRRIADAGLAGRVTCLEASFDALPATVDAADMACAIESFAHAVDPARFFAECRRLLRPGGLLVICDDFERPGARPRGTRTIARFVRGWHLNTLMRSDELSVLAAEFGFVHERTEDLSPYLEPRSARDRVLETLLGWMPLDRTPLGPVLAGAALQSCLARGWTGYELSIFQRKK